MPQAFIAQLEQVCQRRRRCRWLEVVCWAVVAVSVAALVLVGLDRALGIVDSLGRTLLTTAFVAIGLLVARRGVRALSANRVTPLQIAHEVERRHPQLRDVATSAWDFDKQTGNDPGLGSESLRRAVVLRAVAEVDQIDWPHLVPRQAVRRSVLALFGLLAALSLLDWFLPQAIGIGLSRLANPLNGVEWPRDHDLQFVKPPALLGVGDDLILQLRDTRGALPSSVTIYYRTRRQRRWHEERQVLASVSDRLEIRRPNLQRSLQYRATGGDHRSMPWQSLEVVVPPAVEAMQLTVHPPAYTELPVRPWDNNSPIYAGSELALHGRADQPVRDVVLRSKRGTQLPAQVSADGYSFCVEPTCWRITESDTFTLQLTTAAGLVARSTADLTLQVVADRPPQVRFVEPSSDLTVLPTVAVGLVVEASDEFEVREIGLVYRRSDRSEAGDQRFPIWPTTNDLNVAAVARKRVELLWQLAPLSLEPGCVVEVVAEASDNRPATGQLALGQSVPALRLRVVSETELWHQIVEQQRLVGERLAQLLRAQRGLRGVTLEWAEIPAWSAERWVNASHTALFGQRQIPAALAVGPHCVLRQLAQLSQTIRRNGLFRPEETDRLQTGQALLQNLVDAPLAAAEQSLSELARQSQQFSDRETLRPLLVATAQQQEQVVAGLRRVVDLLTPANVLGRLEGELLALETDQTDLADHCRKEVTPQVLQSEAANTAVQAVLSGAVRRQQELASRLAEIMLELAQAAKQLADDEPSLAARLADTVNLADELRVQATIEAAAKQLASRRLGRSASLQQETLDALAQLLARLAGQDAEGAAERFARLQTTERQLQRLRRQVAKSLGELREFTPARRQRAIDRLDRQRQELAEETEALTRQLQRLHVQPAATATRTAASLLRRVKLDSETMQQAQQQLDTAQRQLTTERRRQQVALARLQLAQLDAKLPVFVGLQQAILSEIVRLESLGAVGQRSNAEQENLRQLTGRQEDLRSAVTAQADRLTSLPVFAYLLGRAGETMQRVRERLQGSEFGQPAQEIAEQAVRQLIELAEAVGQERQSLSAEKRGSREQGGGEGEAGDTAQEQTLQLALGQLKLLKSLQVALRERTQTLERQHAAGQSATHWASELAHQQRQLTELARQLVTEPPSPPTDRLFPNLEQQLQQSLEGIRLPRTNQENLP